MNPFAIAKPRDFAEASSLLQDSRFKLPVLKAGGMDLVDHWKEGLTSPDLVIDVRRLRAAGATAPIGADGDRIRIEAGATLDDIANSAELRSRAPVLPMAVELAATPQVRNVASAAGNLLQRPRCWYYRNEQFHCLKKGGATCFALDGENQYHAIFGEGPCYIVHPSNLAPALFVCDGVVHLVGGDRASLPIADLYHTPDAGVRTEHNLKPGEVITHITLKPAPKSGFYAVKEKQSFDWPLVFAAVALELDGSTIKAARVCAGAVAPVPRPLPAVEKALVGAKIDDAASVRQACMKSVDGAQPMSQNAYKVKLLPVAVHRAVLGAAGRDVEA
ncbi:MAG: FAD binding domain-containing protein [Phycisphaerales bacterium]